VKSAFASVCVGLSALLVALLANAGTVTIQGNSPTVGNCYPFGGTDNSPGWVPFAGFVYKNVPKFNLQPGDTLAFDLAVQNEVDDQLQIDMVATTTNGGDIPAGAYTTVVPNTQLPQNPRGNTILGDFEMRFTITQAFNFPGGGLIIRFSNPGPALAADTSCDQVMNRADSSDSSGFFVERFYGDPDGLPPYSTVGNSSIGAFRVIFTDPAVPTLDPRLLVVLAAATLLLGIWGIRRLRR
jgi:hypothetical protein